MIKAKKTYLHVAIAFLIILFIKLFVPTANGLTEVGKNVLCVMVSTVYMWLALGTGWVSLLTLAMVVVFGLMTPSALYSATIGNSTIMVIIVCVLLNQVLVDSGAVHFIATWFLTRNVLKGRPKVFFILYLLGLMLLGFVMNGTALCVTFIALAKGLCDETGYKKGDPFYTALFAGTFWIANVANSATPISHPGVMTIIGIAETAGIPISFTDFMSIGIPYAFLMYIATVIVICFIWKPDSSNYVNYDVDAHKAKRKPLTKIGKISLFVFLAVVAFWIVPDFILMIGPNSIASTVRGWGATIPTIIGFCILSVIHINDKPIADYNTQIKQTPMSIVIFVSAVLVLGRIINIEGAGVTEALQALLAPITTTISPFGLCALVFVLCAILTNFISNSVSAVLFFSICIPILVGTSVSTMAFSICISIVANYGILVPSSCAFSPLFYGENHITVQNVLKWNLMTIAAEVIMVIAIIFPLANAIF